MKFGAVLKTQGIPEWKEMYLNYKILKSLVKPYKTMAKVYKNINFLEHKDAPDHAAIMITNANTQFFDELKHFGLLFEEIILSEFVKISNFYEFKLVEELRRWKLFKINITILQNIQNDKDYDLKKIQLLNAFHYFYKELNLLYEYISVNQEGLRKIIKKFKKNSKSIDPCYKGVKRQIRELISKSLLRSAVQKLIFLRTEVENSYIDTFFKKYDRKDGQNTLRKIAQGKLMTHQQTFLFGFFLGFACLLLIVIFTLALFLSYDAEFMVAFNLFKGIGLIILFCWMLALNVYFWIQSNINYKLIFHFNFHFSEISEIFKRVSIFTIIFLIMLVCYMLLHLYTHKFGGTIAWFPQNLAPIVVWILFFTYLMFPSTQLFNPLGRLYILKLLKEIAWSLFQRSSVSFRAIWGLDQFVSFAGIAREINYLFLILTYPRFIPQQEHFYLGYVMILVVQLLKMIQSVRLLFDKLNFKSVQIIFILRDLLVLLLVYDDMLLLSHIQNGPFFIMALLFSVFVALCDIIVDWSLLRREPDSRFLRKELSFHYPIIYYSFMLLNFLLRACWILTLLPENLHLVSTNPYILPLFEILEMARRGLWNFLIIEKQHIMNCGIFKAVEEIKLPYEDIQFELDEKSFYEEDMKLEGRGYKKSVSDIEFPLMKSSAITFAIKSKSFEENERPPRLKMEKLFDSSVGKKISERYSSKKDFKKLREEAKKFCDDVKFDMEFNFQVVKERKSDEEAGSRNVSQFQRRAARRPSIELEYKEKK